MKGLKDGDSELGLPKAEDTGIISQLDLVGSFWSVVKPLVEKTSNMDNYVSKEEAAAVVELPSTILKKWTRPSRCMRPCLNSYRSKSL